MSRAATSLERAAYHADQCWSEGEVCEEWVIEQLERAGMIVTDAAESIYADDKAALEWARYEGFEKISTWTDQGREYLTNLERRIKIKEIREPKVGISMAHISKFPGFMSWRDEMIEINPRLHVSDFMFHGSGQPIEKLDLSPLIKRSYSDSQGSRALGFYGVKDPSAALMYGNYLHAFTLNPGAVIKPVPDWFRENGRCSAFYTGVRECALEFGAQVLEIEGCRVIIDMSVIENWSCIGKAE